MKDNSTTVLLVDDDDEILRSVKTMLERVGLGVWIASLRKTTLAYNFSIKSYHPKAKS